MSMTAEDDWYIDPQEHESAIQQAHDDYLDDKIDEQKLDEYLEFIYQHGEHPDEIDAFDYVANCISQHEHVTEIRVTSDLFRHLLVDIDYTGYVGDNYHVFGVSVTIDESVEQLEVVTDEP